MKNNKYHGVYMKLHQVNDKDIIEKLNSVPNKQGYIKEAIRADIFLDKFYDASLKSYICK